MSGGIILAGGSCGLACFGSIEAVLGLGAGVAAGGSIAEFNRFYRD